MKIEARLSSRLDCVYVYVCGPFDAPEPELLTQALFFIKILSVSNLVQISFGSLFFDEFTEDTQETEQ